MGGPREKHAEAPRFLRCKVSLGWVVVSWVLLSLLWLGALLARAESRRPEGRPFLLPRGAVKDTSE